MQTVAVFAALNRIPNYMSEPTGLKAGRSDKAGLARRDSR
jgi:hypothetical protein